MAFQIKHMRPGVLVVADAGLRFGPGQVLEVEALTPQLERALAAGLLVRTDDEPKTGADTPPDPDSATGLDEAAGPEEAEAPEVDLSKFRAAEAISKVEGERDPARLRAHLSHEKRRTVIGALEKRLSEVQAGKR